MVRSSPTPSMRISAASDSLLKNNSRQIGNITFAYLTLTANDTLTHSISLNSMVSRGVKHLLRQEVLDGEAIYMQLAQPSTSIIAQ